MSIEKNIQIKSPESTTSHESLHNSERLRSNHEKHESSHKAHARHEREHTEARRTVEKEAISGKELAPKRQEGHSQKQLHTRAEEKVHSFNTTMHHVRQHMKKRDRAFSKVIHHPVVEKVSEVTGKTVGRPSGILGATIAAFVGLLSVYGIAKFAGFALSGSEMPLLLVIGFSVGLLLEWCVKSTRSIFRPKSTL